MKIPVHRMRYGLGISIYYAYRRRFRHNYILCLNNALNNWFSFLLPAFLIKPYAVCTVHHINHMVHIIYHKMYTVHRPSANVLLNTIKIPIPIPATYIWSHLTVKNRSKFQEIMNTVHSSATSCCELVEVACDVLALWHTQQLVQFSSWWKLHATKIAASCCVCHGTYRDNYRRILFKPPHRR